MSLEESIERANARLIFAKAHIRAVTAEYVRLRHWQGNAGFTRISQDEFACLDWLPVSGEWFDAAALDCRLVDAIFITERIQIARLRAEILHGQDADTRKTLELLPSDAEDPAPVFLGIAERAQADVDFAIAIRQVPILRIVEAAVSELPRSRRHPLAERFGQALQRILGKAEGFEARIADPDSNP